MATKENVLKLLNDVGAVEKRKSGKGHGCYLLPTGIVYSVPVSAHDHRVWDNSMSRLKQMLGEYLPEEYRPKNKRSQVPERTTKIRKTNHLRKPAFSDLTPIVAPVKTVAQQLIDAGLAEAPIPVAERKRNIRDLYQHRVYQRDEEQQSQMQEQSSDSRGQEQEIIPRNLEPPLRWHDVRPPSRPKTSRLKENRICSVATPEFLEQANRILREQGEHAYQAFMKNPQIKTKLEVTEIPMPPRKSAPVPMMEVVVKPEPQKPMEDMNTLQLNAAKARLLTIDEEIQVAERKAEEYMALAEGLKQGKIELTEFVDYHAKMQEKSSKLSSFLKVEEPVAPPPKVIKIPKMVSSEMILTECADLLDRDGPGVKNNVLWQRMIDNYPGIEGQVDSKEVAKRTTYLRKERRLEAIDYGLYRFSKEEQQRYRPKKAAANGHAPEPAANTPQQSAMTH